VMSPLAKAVMSPNCAPRVSSSLSGLRPFHNPCSSQYMETNWRRSLALNASSCDRVMLYWFTVVGKPSSGLSERTVGRHAQGCTYQ
jgi:hypothetical protein